MTTTPATLTPATLRTQRLALTLTKQAALGYIAWTSTRSAWERGVKAYAIDLVESLEGEYSPAALLKGARTWKDYSYRKSALIHDADIAKRLCNPTELRRKRGGELLPRSSETWLDCQARALYQAALLVHDAFTA
jgi:hypothetical protein